MIRLKFLIISLLLSCTICGQQQPRLAGSGIEAKFVYGKILKHTPNFKAPIPEHSTAFEINFVQQTFGKKEWHRRHNYPLVGFALAYTNYDIDSVYGKCFSIYPNLQIPIIRGKNIEWTIRAGFGLGYLTNPYERAPDWDTTNNAIGSRINNYSAFSTDIRYRINRNWDVQTGLNFSHVSNANLRQPNLGINLFGAHIGFRYFPVNSSPEKIQREPIPLKNRWLLQARFGIAGIEMATADGPLYPIYLGSLYASKRYLSKNKAFAGVDYSYHDNIYAFLRNNEIMVGEERANSKAATIFLGNEFLFGRIGIHLQAGFYLRRLPTIQNKMYQKLGANVYLLQQEKGMFKELFLSILLKTHLAEAELAELGIGVGI